MCAVDKTFRSETDIKPSFPDYNKTEKLLKCSYNYMDISHFSHLILNDFSTPALNASIKHDVHQNDETVYT